MLNISDSISYYATFTLFVLILIALIIVVQYKRVMKRRNERLRLEKQEERLKSHKEYMERLKRSLHEEPTNTSCKVPHGCFVSNELSNIKKFGCNVPPVRRPKPTPIPPRPNNKNYTAKISTVRNHVKRDNDDDDVMDAVLSAYVVSELIQEDTSIKTGGGEFGGGGSSSSWESNSSNNSDSSSCSSSSSDSCSNSSGDY